MIVEIASEIVSRSPVDFVQTDVEMTDMLSTCYASSMITGAGVGAAIGNLRSRHLNKSITIEDLSPEEKRRVVRSDDEAVAVREIVRSRVTEDTIKWGAAGAMVVGNVEIILQVIIDSTP